MEKRNKWIMRRVVKVAAYVMQSDSINPRPWQPGGMRLTQGDLDESIPGYLPHNRLHIDDLRVDLCQAQANHAIWKMIHG